LKLQKNPAVALFEPDELDAAFSFLRHKNAETYKSITFTTFLPAAAIQHRSL
jgi:hypothetical protein